jgi:hypothetical protein
MIHPSARNAFHNHVVRGQRLNQCCNGDKQAVNPFAYGRVFGTQESCRRLQICDCKPEILKTGSRVILPIYFLAFCNNFRLQGVRNILFPG